ncbi:MAG: hybrid sensor histidine kinase/response regulator [Cyclobacteriaceae bacterium]|nr:hybrid sensor histidine kinase/response regulator [Cyclobacteriaceae bacterium]
MKQLFNTDKPLRIVMLEDLEEDAGLIDRVLKKEQFVYERVRVDTRDEFVAALTEFRPDVVLSDHSLPQFNSIEALEICREHRSSLPFILVTGAVSEEFAVNCLKRGADDYVLKSNLSRLPLAIRHALKQKVLERDKRRQQLKLQRKNKELIKINGELDTFVYNISHNLRAPLTSILGVINVTKLDKERSSENTNFYLQLIEKSVLRLDDTIHEILDYSRNARHELQIDVVSLSELIWRCINHFHYLEIFDRVRKEVEVLGEPVVYADSYRLGVALSNIISNALNYQDKTKQEQHLHIVAKVTPEEILIIIRDNGLGIANSLLPRVFDMFYRANEESQGAGLGLYIAREVVEKMGGRLSLSSVQYEGTSVSILIPHKHPNMKNPELPATKPSQ